ncbi:hypothetical protein FXO38_24872 [Capsicum annuum]|nr:hypothetical protein FXO38_24872 [Capsicum annuum]
MTLVFSNNVDEDEDEDEGGHRPNIATGESENAYTRPSFTGEFENEYARGSPHECIYFAAIVVQFSQQFWLLCVELLLHLRAISVVEISFSASAAASAVYDEQQPQKWMLSVISTLIVAVYLKLEKVFETPKISLRHVPASQVKEFPEELVKKEVTILKE